jgi:radical SAM superfamily enzyme YgiQ (UPF0313 family)
MAQDLLLVKSVTSGVEAFFSGDDINGFNLLRDVPLPSIPVLSAWVKSKGFDVGFYDLDKGDTDGLLEKAKDYDVVGFYLSFSNHFPVQEAARRLKTELPDKLLVVGGPSIGNLREDFFRLSTSKALGLIKERFGDYVDFLVYGEGETALESILRHKDNPEAVAHLIDRGDESGNGIYYRDPGGELHISKKPAVLEDLGLLPVPDFAMNEGQIPVAFIETSRGCAYRCPFCEMPAMYETRRVKDGAQIEREVDRLEELGIRHVIITDPSIYPTARMDMLSDIFSGRGMKWTGYARAGTWKGVRPYYSEETLQKAKDSGCISLFFGGESASEKTQKMYGKPHLDVMIQTEKVCKNVGILSCWSFMLLNPNETSEDIDRLIELLIEMDPGMVVFGPFSILPNSDMDISPERYNLQIKNPEYKLRTPELYARFSKSAGQKKRDRTAHLLEKHPGLFRVLIKLQLSKANYFRNTVTGMDFADGVFQMLRLDAELRKKTNIEVGKSNYHMMFEAAARSELMAEHSDRP